tara:strand:+ start:50 stop:382 length:333 start_codon:yes stop_codon:yes gene_type:complete
MKELYVLCFTIIILTTIHLMISQGLRENFATFCPPDTVQGSAFQSFDNPFKSRCFASSGEMDPYIDDPSSQDSDGSVNVSSDNYCPLSSRSDPYDSSQSNVKAWCNIPDF